MILTLSSAQMRASDEYTINALGVSSLTLMERAGKAIADRALSILKNDGDRASALIVCGGGNNGGDGFVVARKLLESGINVEVLLLSDKLSHDEEHMKNLYSGNIIYTYPDKKYNLIIDCIFGTGLKRDIEGAYAQIIEAINSSGAVVLSADIPSGINGDNGKKIGCAVEADETVTIGEYKNGLILLDGRDCSGKITRADIGITVKDSPNTFLVEASDIKKLFPKRKSNSHKGTYGRAVIIGGSYAYSGAPMLSALAALNTGAGYTYLCAPHILYSHYISRSPELILKDMGGEKELLPITENLEELLSADSVAVGMGCGVGVNIYGVIKYFLENYSGTLIIDADGINSLAKYGADILKGAKCKVVLTPHIKEFSRLSALSVDEILSSPIESARSFADKYGVTLVLKNNSTIISDGKNSYVIACAPPSLARGGSGDVLAGIICALAAMGKGVIESAYGGSYLLGAAALEAEKEVGEYSVTPTLVISSIGKAIKNL